jgi:hypothetical protein
MTSLLDMGQADDGTIFLVGTTSTGGLRIATLDLSGSVPTAGALVPVGGQDLGSCQVETISVEARATGGTLSPLAAGLCTQRGQQLAFCLDEGAGADFHASPGLPGGATRLPSGACVVASEDQLSIRASGGGWSVYSGAAPVAPASLGPWGANDTYLYARSGGVVRMVTPDGSGTTIAQIRHPRRMRLVDLGGGQLWSVLFDDLGLVYVSGDETCDLSIERSANVDSTLGVVVTGGALLTVHGFNNGDGYDEVAFELLQPGVGVEQERIDVGLLPAAMWLFEQGGTVYLAALDRGVGGLRIDPLCP